MKRQVQRLFRDGINDILFLMHRLQSFGIGLAAMMEGIQLRIIRTFPFLRDPYHTRIGDVVAFSTGVPIAVGIADLRRAVSCSVLVIRRNLDPYLVACRKIGGYDPVAGCTIDIQRLN